MCNTESNPNTDSECWVIIIAQYRFVNYNKRTALGGDVDIGRGCALVKVGGM